jgi:hypothetical protein
MTYTLATPPAQGTSRVHTVAKKGATCARTSGGIAVKYYYARITHASRVAKTGHVCQEAS